jgi:hypothetical protein
VAFPPILSLDTKTNYTYRELHVLGKEKLLLTYIERAVPENKNFLISFVKGTKELCSQFSRSLV